MEPETNHSDTPSEVNTTVRAESAFVAGGDRYPADRNYAQNGGMVTGRDPQATFAVERPLQSNIRHLEIDQLNFGYIVTVGCHKFAIEDHKKVSKLIEQYMKDPQGTEEKWFSGELEGLKK